jgi:hypothetical protein
VTPPGLDRGCGVQRDGEGSGETIALSTLATGEIGQARWLVRYDTASVFPLLATPKSTRMNDGESFLLTRFSNVG